MTIHSAGIIRDKEKIVFLQAFSEVPSECKLLICLHLYKESWWRRPPLMQ